MSFAHKVVLWVMMQRRGYLVRLNKRQNFSSHVIVLTSEVIFFNEIVWVATSANAGELTE